MDRQICSKCGVEKLIDDFEFRNDIHDYRRQCRGCRRKAGRKYYRENKEKCDERNKRNYYLNYEKYKATAREYERNRRATDDNYRIITNLRGRLRDALQSQITYKNNSTMDIIGCSKEFLCHWLQFTKMYYCPYSLLTQIDHLRPQIMKNYWMLVTGEI